MNRDAFVQAVYLLSEGELPDFDSNDEEYQTIVATGNLKIDEWANETDWASLYDGETTVGTVSAGKRTFDLPDELRKLSTTLGDSVVIRKDSQDYEYDTVTPDDLRRIGGRVCAKQGRSLVFAKAFSADDSQVGGTLLVPGYLYPEKLESASSTVPVDDPNWLVKITAAEIVRKDVSNQNQYANLVAEANALMENMKRDNTAQFNEVIAPWSPGGRSW